MEKRLEKLQGFLEALNHYCDASDQTDHWYENMKKQLEQDQESKRVLNEDGFRKQQISYKAMQEKTAAERDELQDRVRSKILKKKELLEKNIRENEENRDRILDYRNEITRPEYFQYAYRYREYGDFYPKITKLEDFRSLDLDEMVAGINLGGSGIWMNKIRALFKSEDMMLEYASFANLMGKARYLCEVENDALRDKAQKEIRQLERELDEAEETFLKQASDLVKKQQKIKKDNEAYDKMFFTACEGEKAHLLEDYRNRQMKNYETLRNTLRDEYPAETMQEIYDALKEAERSQKKYICGDGIPLPVKLGQLWYRSSDALKNTYVKQLLEKDYPFTISEGRLSIPGIA